MIEVPGYLGQTHNGCPYDLIVAVLKRYTKGGNCLVTSNVAECGCGSPADVSLGGAEQSNQYWGCLRILHAEPHSVSQLIHEVLVGVLPGGEHDACACLKQIDITSSEKSYNGLNSYVRIMTLCYVLKDCASKWRSDSIQCRHRTSADFWRAFRGSEYML